MSAGHAPFRPKVRCRGSEWARWLRLVAFLFGNHVKTHGHRQTLDNDPCVQAGKFNAGDSHKGYAAATPWAAASRRPDPDHATVVRRTFVRRLETGGHHRLRVPFQRAALQNHRPPMSLAHTKQCQQHPTEPTKTKKKETIKQEHSGTCLSTTASTKLIWEKTPLIWTALEARGEFWRF